MKKKKLQKIYLENLKEIINKITDTQEKYATTLEKMSQLKVIL